jgi:hypothetical protein
MIELFYPVSQNIVPEQPKVKRPRRSQRFSMPTCDLPIQVDLHTADRRHSCQLWDVSDHGACLLLRSPVAPGQLAHLRIYSPSGGHRIEAHAEVRWQDPVMGTYYAGLAFARPLDLASTFLATLIRNSAVLGRSLQVAA